MRMRLFLASPLVLALLVASSGLSDAQEARPQQVDGIQATLGTAMTYQGRLTEEGAPANGVFDLRFVLFDSETDGAQVGGANALDDAQVSAGAFTVPLNFGSVFDGKALWLEVSVRPGAETGDYDTLSPRQLLTAAPYALHSMDAWNLRGNAATSPGLNFLGTTDAQPLVLKTGGVEAMRIDAAGNVSVGTTGTQAKFEASGLTTGGIALMGTSPTRAVVGRLGLGVSCPGNFGVGGCAGSTGMIGVLGVSDTGVAVHGTSTSGRAVEGFSTNGIGVIGDSTTRGVVGTLGRTSCGGAFAVGGCAGAAVAAGVYAQSESTIAVLAATNGGNLFVGQTSGAPVARIDRTGRGFFNGGTQTGGADYAETMRTTEDPQALEPGDVLAIDPADGRAVRLSREPNSRLVVGVYSTKPAYLAVGEHGIDDPLTGEVPVALLGVVPTKVSAENGPIEVGDLLVTSSLPGRAMKSKPSLVGGVLVYPTGAILGKALEPLRQGVGVIAVLVTLK